jgi:dihydrofolate reductase
MSFSGLRRPTTDKRQEADMGKVVVTEFITLDGVIEDPGGAEGSPKGGWAFRYQAGPDSEQFKFEELKASDAQLLGRITYDGFAKAWPTIEAGEFSEKMNGMPKYVVSSTLVDPAWSNTTVIGADLAAEVATLKQRYEGDILVAGSAQLVQALLAEGLVDELHLIVYPVVLGGGKTLFGEGDEIPLELRETRRLGDCILAVYAR